MKSYKLPNIYNKDRLNQLMLDRDKEDIIFCWTNHYSDTTEMDKHGRWERVCRVSYNDDPFDSLLVGTIGQPERGIFNYHTNFPVTSNQKGTFSDIEYTEEEAKNKIEILFVEYKNRINSLRKKK